VNSVRKDIHHPDAVEESNHDLESGWVESHTEGIVLELLVDLQLKAE